MGDERGLRLRHGRDGSRWPSSVDVATSTAASIGIATDSPASSLSEDCCIDGYRSSRDHPASVWVAKRLFVNQPDGHEHPKLAPLNHVAKPNAVVVALEPVVQTAYLDLVYVESNAGWHMLERERPLAKTCVAGAYRCSGAPRAISHR